jgi:hypothetical protein
LESEGVCIKVISKREHLRISPISINMEIMYTKMKESHLKKLFRILECSVLRMPQRQ